MSSIAWNSSTLHNSQPIPAAAASSTSSNAASSATSAGIGSTFLNLLVQELQNQDPTAPMDSTAMVGQMISLNQLDQLVSINQALGGSASTTAGATAPVTRAAQQTTAAAASTPATAQSLPFDPTTMLPVGFATNDAVTNALNTPLASPTGIPATTSPFLATR